MHYGRPVILLVVVVAHLLPLFANILNSSKRRFKRKNDYADGALDPALKGLSLPTFLKIQYSLLHR